MSQQLFDPILIEKSTQDSRTLIMPHQKDAVDAMTRYFGENLDSPNRSGIVVMPTGSGKTFTAVNWLLTKGVANGYRVVWLVHRKELVEQTFQEFRKLSPLLKGTGIKKLRVFAVSGDHLRMANAARAEVYVCSIASVANRYGYRFIERMVGAQGKRKLIIVVDEAHHAVAASYQKVIKRMTSLNPNRILLGLTATPTRMQESEKYRLQKMFNVDENIKNHIGQHGYIYEITLQKLIQSGFLANPIYEKINTEIVGKIEYNLTPEDEAFFSKFGELSARLMERIGRSAVRNKKIVEQYLQHKERYGKTLVFALDQNHAETLYNEFRAAGVNCDFVISNKANSSETISRFKKNEVDVLINVQILTEGSDVPDVQTVFLTRQTNSDSLLMQMIGRGLRGVKAGGTETAYIVAFNDVWDRFMQFMDPGELDIFTDPPTCRDEKEAAAEEPKEEPVEIKPDEEMLKLLQRLSAGNTLETPDGNEGGDIIPGEITPEITSRDLYLKLYSLMKASLSKEAEPLRFPIGWYSVTDDEGEDRTLFVFEGQQESYQDIERNISLIKGKITASTLTKVYFSNCVVKPDVKELSYLLNYIEDTDSMPPFFTFEERDALDPAKIAAKVKAMFEKEEDRDVWLKELFDNAPILQQIYKYFFAFRKTVYDADKAEEKASLTTEDERKEYSIGENYYNLQELLKEVLDMYPLLSAESVIRITWTQKVIKDSFAVTQADESFEHFQIFVNMILSSSKVNREVIKYLIFHELLHVNGYWSHDEGFRKREWQYPNSTELDAFLDSLSLEYNLDIASKDAVSSVKYDPVFQEGFVVEEKKQDPAGKEESIQSFNPNAKGVEKGYKYCRNCGNKLPEDANFCDKCGQALNY